MPAYTLSDDLKPVDNDRFVELRAVWPEHQQDVFKITETLTEQTASVTLHLQTLALYSAGPPGGKDVYFEMEQVTYVVWREKPPELDQ